jgi:hypothetical protein
VFSSRGRCLGFLRVAARKIKKKPVFTEKNARVCQGRRLRVAREAITYVARRLCSHGGGRTVTATCGDARSAKVDANGLHKFPKFVG